MTVAVVTMLSALRDADMLALASDFARQVLVVDRQVSLLGSTSTSHDQCTAPSTYNRGLLACSASPSLQCMSPCHSRLIVVRHALVHAQH